MAKKIFIIAILFTLFQSATPPEANAVYGGNLALDDVRVVTLNVGDSTSPFCTMALIEERIVVTAAHCMAAPDSTDTLRFQKDTLWITPPGKYTASVNPKDRVKVLKVLLPPKYENYWNPSKNDYRTTIDDIAFLFLEKPLVPGYKVKVASREKVLELKQQKTLIRHYGYGLQRAGRRDQNPYYVDLRIKAHPSDYELKRLNIPELRATEEKTLITDEADGKSLCPGDSGGPWYYDPQGENLLVAVTSGASGCNPEAGDGGTFGTLIWPYLDWMYLEWAKFLESEPEISFERERERIQAELQSKITEELKSKAKADGTLLQTPGCHARGLVAEVQYRGDDGSWTKLTNALGWSENLPGMCPATHPVTPWAIVDVSNGTVLRWRWRSGSWDLQSEPFIWENKVISERENAKVAAELKAKQEAEAAALAAAAKSKKTTITCVKGKATKKITAVNPKCPKGYKKR